MQEVTGSSPVPSTIQFVLEPDSLRKRVRVRFLFIGSSAARVRRAVNEQRQGIIVAMVSCLLLCRIKFALCELGRPLYGALGAIAAYVRTGRACTPLARCNTLDFVPKSVCQGAAPLWNPCGAGTHVRRKMAKFHYIGGVLSLESMVYSAWPSKSEFEELIDWTNQNFIKNLVH